MGLIFFRSKITELIQYNIKLLKGQCGSNESVKVFHYFNVSEIIRNQSFTENIQTSQSSWLNPLVGKRQDNQESMPVGEKVLIQESTCEDALIPLHYRHYLNYCYCHDSC